MPGDSRCHRPGAANRCSRGRATPRAIGRERPIGADGAGRLQVRSVCAGGTGVTDAPRRKPALIPALSLVPDVTAESQHVELRELADAIGVATEESVRAESTERTREPENGENNYSLAY